MTNATENAALSRLRARAAAALFFLSRWPVACAALALAQSLAVGWIVLDRMSILQAEREIVLTPEPVDPRDLLRGDYVILSYAIARPPVDGDDEQNWPTLDLPVADGRALWARIRRGQDGVWRTVEVTRTRPAAEAENGPAGASEDAVWLRAWADGYARDDRIKATSLRFGIERYYVPEGEGLPLEKMIGEKRIQVAIAISQGGRAAIKALRVDGETVFEEPWF